MNQKGFANIMLIILVVVLAGALGYVALVKKSPEPSSVPQENTNNVNTVTPPVTTNTATSKPQLTYPDAKTFLPSKATLNGELKLDLEGDGVNEVAIAYAIALNQENNDFNTGVRILKYTDTNGWKVAFEDTDRVGKWWWRERCSWYRKSFWSKQQGSGFGGAYGIWSRHSNALASYSIC